MSKKISTDVLAVLDACEMKGNELKITAQLDRPMYNAVNKVLEAAGGKWDRKAKAHLFDGEAADIIEVIVLTGEYTDLKQELGAFFTPPALARRIVAEQIVPSMTMLEPNAGHGALAIPARSAGAMVTCIDIHPANVQWLRDNTNAMQIWDAVDFLTVTPPPPAGLFDIALMNPPFGKQADIKNVMHAMKFVKRGGRVVAIMSAGTAFRVLGLGPKFRELVEARGGSIEHLPPDSFKSSGTSVNTVLVTIPC